MHLDADGVTAASNRNVMQWADKIRAKNTLQVISGQPKLSRKRGNIRRMNHVKFDGKDDALGKVHA